MFRAYFNIRLRMLRFYETCNTFLLKNKTYLCVCNRRGILTRFHYHCHYYWINVCAKEHEQTKQTVENTAC